MASQYADKDENARMVDGVAGNLPGSATRQPSPRRLFDGPSAQHILDQYGGAFPGFDTLRLCLALLVVLVHSCLLSYGRDGSRALLNAPYVSFMLSLLPLFFSLSGYLIAGSALRLRDTTSFLLFRVLRIGPALAVEVAISALILGPLLTTCPLRDYFTSADFFAYFGNIIGRVHFGLPGLFEGLPVDRIVNGNLWTLKPEFLCYTIMAPLMMSGLAYDRKLATLCWAAVTGGLIVLNQVTDVLEPQGYFGPNLLVYSFVTGFVAFHWREHIRLNSAAAIIAAAAAYFLLLVPKGALFSIPALTYVMIWIGAQRLPRIDGDYSYGVYLFSYPIQQTLVSKLLLIRDWWLLFPASALIALAVAALSWHLIERPSLRLKKPILALALRARTRLVAAIAKCAEPLRPI